MAVLNLLTIFALVTPPIFLAYIWWTRSRAPHIPTSKWRTIFFLSGLCAGTANFLLFWSWVLWLNTHRSPTVWKVYDKVSDVGLYLLLYAVIASIAGKGKPRILLAISAILAILPWIPMGVL